MHLHPQPAGHSARERHHIITPANLITHHPGGKRTSAAETWCANLTAGVDLEAAQGSLAAAADAVGTRRVQRLGDAAARVDNREIVLVDGILSHVRLGTDSDDLLSDVRH